MPKERKKKSTIKNNEPKYQISQNLLEQRGFSFPFMIASRLNDIGKITEEEIVKLKLSELLKLCSDIKKEPNVFIFPLNKIFLFKSDFSMYVL